MTLFFANRAYVETGDESLPRLIPEPRVLQADETSLAEAAVRALQTGPRSPKAAPVIRHDIHIIGVRTARGIAEVNLARANLSGGSLEELLLIQGVVRSLTGLPGIGAVRFLVDGQPTDTLMGHLSVNTPLTEKDLR